MKEQMHCCCMYLLDPVDDTYFTEILNNYKQKCKMARSRNFSIKNEIHAAQVRILS